MRTTWQPLTLGSDDLGLLAVVTLCSWLVGVQWKCPDDYEGQLMIWLHLGPLHFTFNRYCPTKVDPEADPF